MPHKTIETIKAEAVESLRKEFGPLLVATMWTSKNPLLETFLKERLEIGIKQAFEATKPEMFTPPADSYDLGYNNALIKVKDAQHSFLHPKPLEDNK